MKGYEKIPEDILQKGIDLNIIGINEYAWRYDSALELINYLEKNNIVVLGGDVYFVNNNEIISTYDSWYYNETTNIDNCYKQAKKYLEMYKNRNGDSYVYSIIF